MKNKSKNTAIDSFMQGHPRNYMCKRFFALVIDFFIVAFLCQLIYIIFKTPDWPRYLQTQDAVAGLSATDPRVVERMKLYEECFITTLVIAAVYEAFFLVFFGGSPGKLITGLRVVFVREGKSFAACKILLALRSIIKALSLYLLSAIPFVFMCLTAFGNIDRRSGFDIFIGTKVIDARSKK